MRKQILAGMLLLALCGCIKIKDEVTLNADGSGAVRIETGSSIPAEFSEGMGMGVQLGGSGGGFYPPASESDARKFFPEKDFKITVKQTKAQNGEVTTEIEATFTNINTLLASAYGRAHQLSLRITNGTLVVQAITGMEAAARLAEYKPDTGPGMSYGMMPGVADLQKKKGEMRSEFRVILPNPVSATTGTNEGKSAAWIAERAKCKDGDEFAQRVGALCEAKCQATGLTMAPTNPARLGLLPFAQLAAGMAEAGPAFDTNKITAAAKFVPYGLSVTRTLDLSGEGSARESTAQLVGAMTLPGQLAPRQWGEPVLDEAVDVKGNNLKPGTPDEEQRFIQRTRYYQTDRDEDEASATTTIVRHVVTLAFHPPDWKVSEIARVKGSVSLQYFGGSQLVKLTNAVPAKWIMDASKMANGGSRFDSSEKPLESAALSAAGLSLSLQMGLTQGSMTMLTFQTKGKGATLTDAQVFDGDGRPWPTFLQEMNFGSGGDGGSCQIIVAGKPQPPLSIAFLASGSAATVELPILVEHISLSK